MTPPTRLAKASRYDSELDRKLAKTLEESSASFGEKITKTIAAWEAKLDKRRQREERKKPPVTGE